MKNVIGFSAGAVGRDGNVDRMVKAILDGSGHNTEFVKLADQTYSACKGCVQLCSRPQVCMLDDDLRPHYQSIKDADAVVIGAPVYFGAINAMAQSFIERFFGYRHVDIPIAGKPFILVVGGAMMIENATEQFRKKMSDAFQVDVIDVVCFKSRVPPCFKCGRHKECEIGGLYKMLGEAAHQLTVTPEMFTQWENDPGAASAVAQAAEKLKNVGRGAASQ